MMRRSRTVDDLTFLSSAASTRSTFMFTDGTSMSDRLESWMYWQRDALNAKCWTKVYAVLENEFLWIFKGEKSSKALVLQIAIASVEECGGRQLRVVDPNGEDMELWLLDDERFQAWKERLQQAAVITTEVFRTFSVEPKSLPRKSVYRGSLVTYRRASKRARCKAVFTWLTNQFRKRSDRGASV